MAYHPTQTGLATRRAFARKMHGKITSMMNVIQILFTDCDAGQQVLPASLANAAQSAQLAFADHRYQLFDLQMAEGFIATYFSQRVLDSFLALRPYAYKSDLARYCILHELGGWYVDIGLKLLNPIRASDEADLIAFADRGCPSCAPWAIQNGLFFAKAGSPILADAIEAICQNVEERYYGQSPLDPTGPNLFGTIISQHAATRHCIFGEFRPLTPGLPLANLMYISSSGYLIAQHKTSWAPGVEGGDFSKLGVKGTNNYKELWHARNIYQP